MTGATLHRRFADQAARTPDAVGVICGDRRLTYAALESQANRLARVLRRHGVAPGTRVGMLLPRSVDAVATLLAILKAGAAFVPLDPAYPAAQLTTMVGDSAPACVVADRDLLRDLGAAVPWSTPTLVLADLGAAIAAEPDAALPEPGSADDPAYVMYTSGSTGRPKGVVVPHRAVTRLVIDTDYARFAADEVFLQLAPLAFDASTFEIWGSLLHGATLAVVPQPRPTLDDIADAIARHGATTLWLTAGLFHLMVEHRIDALGRLHQLLAGGDVLSPVHVRKLLEAAPGLRLINGYGPTENTTFTCCHTVALQDLDAGTVPIGRPIRGTTVYVLDARMQPVVDGAEGQLCTGGLGVALGYLGQPALTDERFVTDPFAADRAARMYLTGDLVRRRPDGTLLFLGRLDRQVKINGHRVEFEEIELALRRQPGVDDAIALLREDTPGNRRLVAYVTGSSAGLLDALRAALPDWMVPSAVVMLPALPLTANGKVDRGRLPAPESGPTLAPRNGSEQALAAIWQRVLGLETVSRDANFFDLGGTSLQLIEAHAELQRTIAPGIGLIDLFQNPSISGLAAHLARPRPAGGLQAAAAQRAGRAAEAMLRARAAHGR